MGPAHPEKQVPILMDEARKSRPSICPGKIVLRVGGRGSWLLTGGWDDGCIKVPASAAGRVTCSPCHVSELVKLDTGQLFPADGSQLRGTKEQEAEGHCGFGFLEPSP